MGYDDRVVGDFGCGGAILWDTPYLLSERSSAWLEHLVWDQDVAGSNPVAPTIYSMNSPARLWLALASFFFCYASTLARESSIVFKAGAARREVTPKEPVPMWGYGARHDALSTGTLDPLYATALVIEAAGNKLAIVGLDLGRAPSERSLQEIRRRLKAEAGIEYSFIAGSHTHHGPVLELSDEEGKGKGRFDAAIRYYRQLEEGIVGAVVEANSRLASARMATGSVRLEGFNRNRQTKIEPKPVDRELAVLRLDDRAGKTIAVLVNFAAHPTMVPGATLKFSADYVGALRAALEKETGATSIFMQGAAGDLSVNPGSNGGHESFGEALGKEAARLALSLETREATNASLAVREERFQFASRTDLSNPVTRAAYGVAGDGIGQVS